MVPITNVVAFLFFVLILAVVTSQNYTFPPPSAICQQGSVFLGYGDPHYIGLGVSVMVMLVFIEIFGSTFMKYVYLYHLHETHIMATMDRLD